LSNIDNIMTPRNSCCWLLQDVLHDDLADLIERKAGDLVQSAVKQSTIQARDDLSVQFAPAKIPTNQSLGLDIIQYFSTSQLMDSGGSIVGRSWLIV